MDGCMWGLLRERCMWGLCVGGAGANVGGCAWVLEYGGIVVDTMDARSQAVSH